MKKIIIFLMACLPLNCFSQLSQPYNHVDQIMWVVTDLNAVTSGWRKLGFNQIMEVGPMVLPNQEFKGNSSNINAQIALARFHNLNVTLVQPAEGDNAFTQFLKNHGDGVFSLMHRFKSADELEKEVVRLNKIGVSTLQKGSFYTDAGMVTLVFMDTREKGKYTLGFIHGPEVHLPEMTGLSNSAPFNAQFSQFAFAVTEPKPVSEFWQKIGLPSIENATPEIWEKRYYGKEEDFALELGWQRHGSIAYEWCIPKSGKNVYSDHINKHGEGIHHVGYNVDDIDKVIADFVSKGCRVSIR